MSKLLNLRSSIKDKLPEPGQLEYGRLAVNINSQSPMLAFKTNDDSIAVLKPVKEWEGSLEEYQSLTEIDPNTTYYILEDEQ